MNLTDHFSQAGEGASNNLFSTIWKAMLGGGDIPRGTVIKTVEVQKQSIFYFLDSDAGGCDNPVVSNISKVHLDWPAFFP